MRTITLLFISLLFPVFSVSAAQEIKTFKGLDYTIDYPAVVDVSRVVVLIHGSGPQDMNEDLSAVSAPGTRNLFFVDVSSALVSKGFAVVRYDKRAYKWKSRLAKDKAAARSSEFRKYSANPLKHTVEDAAAFAGLAAKLFPKAKVYLLGHSEGSYVALQVADTTARIAGVALIGFSAQSLDTSLFEQTVYRPLHYFTSLDTDMDGSLVPAELQSESPWAKALIAQLGRLDLNKNGSLERSEFMAGNLTNILLDLPSMAEYRRQEALYKKPAAIIKDAAFDVAFFQGELDNQTPAYNARAIQLLNALLWKEKRIHFRFFEGLGHALDKRTSYEDLLFRPADRQALTDMASDLDAYWN
ncbi:MAG TPA: alpha/beta fold hydrolase [Elusimicrobiales bacterium]|nr:alpha/beta fold hydrolase [Elusimicrobiales bacterium]